MIEDEVAEAAPVKAAKPAAKKKAAAQNAGNINDPFTQTWEDEAVLDENKAALDNISHAKRYLAHSYMSAKCDVSELLKTYSTQSVDAFIMKAAQKSYTRVVDKESEVSV